MALVVVGQILDHAHVHPVCWNPTPHYLTGGLSGGVLKNLAVNLISLYTETSQECLYGH